MKKKFVSKVKKKKFKFKFLLFCFLFIGSLVFSFQALLKSKIKIDDKYLVDSILNQSYQKKGNVFTGIMNKIKKEYQPVNLLSTNYFSLVKEKKVSKISEKKEQKSSDYLIYIYNSHQTEEYQANSFLESEVGPTVMMASYIMEDVFNKNSYKTLVEERSIPDLLKANNWRYYRSYDASRIYLNESKEKNPTIKYFIDVHRDSLNRDKTTITINDKSYAKTIFLIGTENPTYQENLEFTTRINDKLNEKYPNLSKGIYQKGGEGVNGLYNQDNSKYTILLEIGGPENKIDEVLNSTLAFCECFLEVLKEDEG